MGGWIIAAVLLAGSPAAAQAPLTPGTVAVEIDPATPLPPEAGRTYAEAVTEALVGANFLALPGAGHSRYVARVQVAQHQQGVGMAAAAVPKPSGGVGNWGAHASVSLPTKNTQLAALIATELTVQLFLRNGMQPAWHGSAVTVGPDGTPATVAHKLAEAVARGFPAVTAEPVSVP